MDPRPPPRFTPTTALAIALAGVLGAVAPAAHGESLADAIALAYQTNPTLQSQRAQLRITDETYVQARAGYRPQVNVQANAQRQDYAQQTSNSGSAAIVLSQPLYTGGRTAAAVGAAEADILAGRETLRQTEAAVLLAVVQGYADVLRDQEGVSIRRQDLAALNDQLAETQARARVGDLTVTDVAQSEGYVFNAKAALASARAQLAISEANYTAVVGQPPGTLEPLPVLPNMPASLEQALKTTEVNNPGVRSAQYGEEAARQRTAQARSQRLPSVSLQAQFGYSGPLSPYLPNVYARQAVATVTVTQPLFAGGVINSQVRQQLARETSARLQTELARRSAVAQLSQAWSTYLATLENVANADDQVKANDAAYEGVQMERRADLRTTLEVLYIEQSLRQAQLSAAGARHDAYVAAANLLGLMGLLEAKALVPGLSAYDPVRAFRAVRYDGAVPWEFIPATLEHLSAPSLRRLPPPLTASAR